MAWVGGKDLQEVSPRGKGILDAELRDEGVRLNSAYLAVCVHSVLPVPRVLRGVGWGGSVWARPGAEHVEHPCGRHGFSVGCSAGRCEEQGESYGGVG